MTKESSSKRITKYIGVNMPIELYQFLEKKSQDEFSNLTQAVIDCVAFQYKKSQEEV